MRYVATRFIDLFRPGDEIPAGHYEPSTLGSLLAKGHVVSQETASDVPPPAAAKEPAAKEPAQEPTQPTVKVKRKGL
jgi:hypothetical protein